MIQSIMKKYHLYIHNGGHQVGDLNLTIDITIPYSDLNGGRSPEFGSGNPGQEWGQGWVGQPVAPNNTRQFHPGPGGSILFVNPGPIPGLSPPDLLFS